MYAETGTVGGERLAYRKKRSKPVLDTIRAAIERMWNDTGLMAVGLLKNAESIRLNDGNIGDYFSDLFRHARSTLSPEDLRSLLPNHYMAKC